MRDSTFGGVHLGSGLARGVIFCHHLDGFFGRLRLGFTSGRFEVCKSFIGVPLTFFGSWHHLSYGFFFLNVFGEGLFAQFFFAEGFNRAFFDAVGVGVADVGKVSQGSPELIDNLSRLKNVNGTRGGVQPGDHCSLMGGVENLNAVTIADNGLADKSAFFFHHHHGKGFTVGDINAQLGAANADGGDRGIDNHRLGVCFGDLAADEGKNTCANRKANRSFLGCRIVNHFIQGDATVFGHGKCRLIDQHKANGAVGGRHDLVSLEDRMADFHFNGQPIGAEDANAALQRIDVTDRFRAIRGCMAL